MSGANNKNFSQQQYDMLIRCSEKKDITEWNNWRKEKPDEKILLEGAQLFHANLQGAEFFYANLQGAKLWDANLKNAVFINADLQSAQLLNADLQGADFWIAIVNGKTLIKDCIIDKKTNFSGVGLDNLRTEPETKAFLKYNIRRLGWEDWYKEHRILQWPTRAFWWLSDYGRITGRILLVFLLFALLFANIYYYWGVWYPPGIVENLFTDKQGQIPQAIVSFRATYFSIVTMTTLGFGDMYAKTRCYSGHVLLSIQVILGYILLGALITRFAVMFTGDGPAEIPKKQKKEQE
ncbi:MAG: pentapeptide repeat-containing protein [Planctomycetota bacterium]|jgi:uncharacterized protein YjbI with pentapeptide repeats